MCIRSAFRSGAAAMVVALAASTSAAQDAGAAARAVLEKRAPAIVTIRMVHELEFGTTKRENRLTARGVLVDGSGLVMTGIGTIEPTVNARGPRGRRVKVEVTPVDVKVIVGNEEKERDAFVAVKDTKRGLAFIQIKEWDAEGGPSAVDFNGAGRARVGDEVVQVSRLAKGFDYATHFRLLRVVGEVKKPRRGLLVAGNGVAGLPVFGLDGAVVGCFGTIEASVAQNPRRRQVILAAAEVAAVIKQALKKAAEGESDPGTSDGGAADEGESPDK